MTVVVVYALLMIYICCGCRAKCMLCRGQTLSNSEEEGHLMRKQEENPYQSLTMHRVACDSGGCLCDIVVVCLMCVNDIHALSYAVIIAGCCTINSSYTISCTSQQPWLKGCCQLHLHSHTIYFLLTSSLVM